MSMPAVEFPGPDWTRQQKIDSALSMLGNTSPYDYTGHPAISLLCGITAAGLPVGLQLIANHFDEPAIFRAAGAFEAAHDWKTL